MADSKSDLIKYFGKGPWWFSMQLAEVLENATLLGFEPGAEIKNWEFYTKGDEFFAVSRDGRSDELGHAVYGISNSIETVASDLEQIVQLSHKPLPFRILEGNFNGMYIIPEIFAGLAITISTAVDIAAYASLNAPGSELISNVFHNRISWGLAALGLASEFVGGASATFYLEGKFIDGFYEKRGSKLHDRVLSYAFDGEAYGVINTAYQALLKGAIYDQISGQELDRNSFVSDKNIVVMPAR